MKPEDLLRHPLHTQTQKLTLNCPLLDLLLHGGIPCGTITEIAAESGVGKIQFSLQLLLAAQLPALRGGLSEFPFPFRRLHQFSLFYRSHVPDNPLDCIFIQPETSRNSGCLKLQCNIVVNAPDRNKLNSEVDSCSVGRYYRRPFRGIL
ncbi:unnamed protein product [Fraxinus pennsylvanica]|uniref:RecA family profile 1 domain-containing protein n=1 Tax=Fraxinus pennsylvanica TaxID=56036 RepID=A0AAD2EFF0_9LAMI|nr:unnamed protein product [Fraxinus pennsylvanica]